MDKLRGTGTTFSTSGKRWEESRINRKIAARNAHLHRLKRKSLTPPGDKRSLRELANQAMEGYPDGLSNRSRNPLNENKR